MKIIVSILVCAVIVAGGIYFSRSKKQPIKPVHEEIQNVKEVVLGSQKFTLEISDTEALRERGLSYRGELPENGGMLFIFPTPSVYQFWMKDMNFPIDIIWLDQNKKVVYIEYSLATSTYPKSFGPTTLTQYVIEIPAGKVKEIGLKVGDNIDL